jgi:hypothetical protein
MKHKMLCICGTSSMVSDSGSRVTCRNCGAELHFVPTGDGGFQAHAFIPEDNLEERRQGGKPVKYPGPKAKW